MYGLNLAEDGRILSATFAQYAAPLAVIVDVLPEGDISDYRYVAGEYIYDTLPAPPDPPDEPSVDDILNALLGVGE